MILHLVIFILAFKAFSASAQSAAHLQLDFFDDDHCGVMPDRTTNTTSVLGTYYPDMTNRTNIQCNTNCSDAKTENSPNDIHSFGLLPNDTNWNYSYGCTIWKKVGDNGGIQNCTNSPSVGFVEAGKCLTLTIPKGDGIWVTCIGLLMGSPVSCPSDLPSGTFSGPSS